MAVTWIRTLAGLGALLALAGTGSAQPPGAPTDGRQRVALPPAGRDKVLSEMRHMLASMGGVLGALSTSDTAAAAKAARASGMGTAADVDPAMKARLPREFLELGMRTHHGFDRLADRIQAGAPQAEILRGLADITGSCVTCHATYRLDEAR